MPAMLKNDLEAIVQSWLDAAIKHFKLSAKDTSEKTLAYLELLNLWNRRMNLTACKALDQQLPELIGCSWALIAYLSQATHVYDVGTGAGIPGIPLSIACPNKKFYLIEKLTKRCYFLQRVKQKLNLSNIQIINADVKAFTPQIVPQVIIARAVAPFDRLLPLLQSLTAVPSKILVPVSNRQAKTITKVEKPWQMLQHHLSCAYNRPNCILLELCLGENKIISS